jgi:AcrR family transcriptional regulator
MSGLKVESLSQLAGVSKSSFYHHFADLDIFVDKLLSYHLDRAVVIAGKERGAGSINPELIQILVDHKIDLLFSRQLRVNQQSPVFREALAKSNSIIGNDFVALWAREHQLNLSQKQLETLFQLALENFYLQINAENLNHAWLSAYFNDLKAMASSFHTAMP